MEGRQRNDVLLVIGLAVLSVGLAALANTLGVMPPLVPMVMRFASRAAGPLAVIVLGILVIVVARKGGISGGTAATASRGGRLCRSRTNRMISGVAGGLGEYLGIDPLILRLGFVLFALGSLGTAVVLYIILAIVIPEQTVEGGTPNA